MFLIIVYREALKNEPSKGLSWMVLDSSWSCLGTVWRLLGHLGVDLGPSGAVLGRLGALLGCLGRDPEDQGCLKTVLELFWGPFWSYFKAILGSFG